MKKTCSEIKIILFNNNYIVVVIFQEIIYHSFIYACGLQNLPIMIPTKIDISWMGAFLNISVFVPI